MADQMKIAIYGHPLTSQNSDIIREILLAMKEKNLSFFVQEAYWQDIRKNCKIDLDCTTFNNRDEIQGVDFFFSFGGDGTILRSSTYVYGTEIPIVGVNLGRLGFLTNFSQEELISKLDSILNKEFNIDQRSMLELTIDGEKQFPMNFALNEITVHRKYSSAMISIDSSLNGKYLNTYWADGLIISTPTGSTGYSLSCGGPIIMPPTKNFVLTPIAPHNLNVRPLVISEEDEITLSVSSRENRHLVTLDTRIYDLDTKTKIIIKKAHFPIYILQSDETSHLSTLREKLHWGKDTRN